MRKDWIIEKVTLVGIVNGDALLNRSDYRSAEMTYDLLEQASGRSGRGEYKGEVIIQAYDPNSLCEFNVLLIMIIYLSFNRKCSIVI